MVIFNRNLRGLGARTHPRFFQDFSLFEFVTSFFIGKCLFEPSQTFSCRCLGFLGSCYVYGTQGYQFWTGIIKVAFHAPPDRVAADHKRNEPIFDITMIRDAIFRDVKIFREVNTSQCHIFAR